MTFNLSIPRPNDTDLDLSVAIGEIVFVLGANGSGKSSLMHRFFTAYKAVARRIHAHRQTWFHTSELTLTHRSKESAELQIHQHDLRPDARWMDHDAHQRIGVAIFELVDAENVRARKIADAFDRNDVAAAKSFSAEEAPLKIINKILQSAKISIEIRVAAKDQIVARRSDGAEYGIAQLSDGERNALLIAAEVLTAPDGTLLLIDEPERHLHRSIISPLLTQLFAHRPDCAFVVSTHEVMLPLDHPNAHTILVRGCIYSGANITGWNAELVRSEMGIDEETKRDILGARSKIFFVEGKERSLDKPLYSLLFPGVSVIAKDGCREVERAVIGIRNSSDLHRIHAFGIVESDRRPQNDLDELKTKGIYAVPFYSVESIYYHPEIQNRIAKRQEAHNNENAANCLKSAKSALIAAVRKNADNLSCRVAEKEIREQFLKHLPRQKDIAAGKPIDVNIDVTTIVSAERSRLDNAIASEDLATIVANYPIREAGVLNEIAKNFGYQSENKYKSAVLKLLTDDPGALEFVRGLFGNLADELDAK